MVARTSSKITTNHDAIRQWAEARGARPVEIDRDDDPGTVRLDASGDSSLRVIGWDDWFAKFERSKLALLYQEQTADGERSNFCKIVRREKADEVENALGGRGRSAARRSARADAASTSGTKPRSEPRIVLRSAAKKTSRKNGGARKAEATGHVSLKNSSRSQRPTLDEKTATERTSPDAS